MNPLEVLKHHVTGAIERGEKEAIVEMKTTEKKWATIESEIRRLLIQLKKHISDDYRCSDDPDDTKPGMLVTVSTKDGMDWSYQTGDNSYTGGCYSHPHWSVIYLYRRSNCAELASQAVEELADLVHEAEYYA